MLAIFEGPDCVGKTGAIRKFSRWFADGHAGSNPLPSVNYHHAGPPTQHPLDEYELPLLEYATGRQLTDLNVFDRWHWGELVYPGVLGRASQLTPAAFYHVELALAARGAVVGYVNTSPEKISDCLRARGDDLVKPESAELMFKLFEEVASRSILPVVYLDGDDIAEDALLELYGTVSRQTAWAVNVRNFVTYVGPPDPQVLLLGDVRGGDPATHGKLPAFLPYRGSCGEYLLEALIEANGYRLPASLGIANANDVDDLDHLLTMTSPNVIIPLGRNAERRVAGRKKLSIKHVVTGVPHPQYQKRFHHDQRLEYGRLILAGCADYL